MSRLRFRRCLPFAIAIVSLANVQAATPIAKSMQELATDAERIVVGTVVEQQARFNDDRSLILTDTTIQVQEVLIGPTEDRVTVSEYGGIVGDRGLAVSGLPRFEEGQRVLLFLCRDFVGLLRTCGANQGKLELRTMPDGGVRGSGQMAGKRVDATLGELLTSIAAARSGGKR